MTARLQTLAPWVLVVLAMLTFAPALGFEFVSWDDPLHVYRNPLVTGDGDVAWWHYLRTPQLGYPSPLTVFTYKLEWLLTGPSAWLFHATNIVLHGVAVFLCYKLGRRIGLGETGALIAAAVFGFHPLVAEPVTWVTGRKDLLAAVFVLAATIECLRHPFHWRAPRTWVAGGLLLLGALCKPVVLFAVVAWPAMHLLLGTQPRAARLRTALWSAAPAMAIAALLFPIALSGQAATGSMEGADGPLEVLRQAWYAAGFHGGLVAMLREHCVKYLPLPWPPPFDPYVDLVPLVYAGMGGLLLVALDPTRRKIAAAAAAFALLAYLPSSSLIPLTRYLADVYLYLPLCGLGWFVGACLERAFERSVRETRRPIVGMLVALAIAGALFGPALNSAERWQNSVTLWAHNYAHYPHDFRLCRNVGNALNERGDREAALQFYLECRQTFATDDFDKNIAVTLFRLGRYPEAHAAFDALARTRPDDPVVRKYLTQLNAMRQGAP